MTHLLEAQGLSKSFPARDGKGVVKAVNDVSLTLAEGETLGIVGESGCGKSTLARMLLRLIEPPAGEVFFRGENLLALNRAEMRQRRRDIQIVFQDPYASLDPRMKIARHHRGAAGHPRRRLAGGARGAGEGPAVARGARSRRRVRAIRMNSPAASASASALPAPSRWSPTLVVLDEPVSALDVSIQSQILNLLDDLKSRLKLSYIFISHDLSVVEHVSDRVAVMYLGRIVEQGPADDVLAQPQGIPIRRR